MLGSSTVEVLPARAPLGVGATRPQIRAEWIRRPLLPLAAIKNESAAIVAVEHEPGFAQLLQIAHALVALGLLIAPGQTG